MKKILAISWKDFLIRFSSPSELLFFVILPVVFTVLLAGGTPSGNEDTRIRLLVVDEAQTALSQQIINELDNSSAIRPEPVTLVEAETQFDNRQASAFLTIPSGTDTDSLQSSSIELVLIQQPNNLDATIAERSVLTAIRRVSSAISAGQNAVAVREAVQAFPTEAEQQTYFLDALEVAQSLQQDTPDWVVIIEGATPDQVEYDPRTNSSAGQLITWVFIPLFGISSLFAYEREQGTLRRLLTTPSRMGTYLLGTIIGQVGVALVQMLLLVGFGVLVMKLHWGREPLGLAVLLISAALSAAAFGTMLGTFIKTSAQANGLSIMFGMIFAMMGGCWYPLELFPPAIQNAVKILPTTWAMEGMLDLGLRGGGVVDILPESAILLGFAIVFFSVGLLRFRFE